MARLSTWTTPLPLAAALLSGCFLDPDPPRCVEGRQVACDCPFGQRSIQICGEDGRYEPCQWDLVGDGDFAGDGDGDFAGDGDGDGDFAGDGDGDFGGDGDGDGDGDAFVPDAGTDLGVCTSTALGFRPIDAEYSSSLDRIVLVSASPNQLVTVDPTSLEALSVTLPLEPAAVSLSPDGKTAAVAHNAFVSIVDLEQLLLTDTIATTSDADDVVLAGNGYAYVFPATDQWVTIHSVELATRTDHGDVDAWSIYAGTLARLHPGGTSIYGITRGLSPTDIERYDISAGVATVASDSPYHGDHPMCSNVWFSEDGSRIFTGCGTAFRAAPGTDDDMTYAGALGGDSTGTRFHWVVHSLATTSVYAIPAGDSFSFPFDDEPSDVEAQVQVFGDDFLALEGVRDIPCLDTVAGKQRVYGRFVFAAADGTAIHVLGKVDPASGAQLDWALATVAP